jgi:hypothetical protein
MLPEFDVAILTVRSGIRTVRVVADDAATAHALVQAECDAGLCHCSPEWCTDDIDSTVLHVRQVVLDNVTLISADSVGPGTLYADDTLRRKEQHQSAVSGPTV